MNTSNIVSNLAAIVPIIEALAGVLGLLLVGLGIFRLAQLHRRADYTAGQGITRIVFGTLLVSFAWTVGSLTMSLTTQSQPESILAPASATGSPVSGIITLAIVSIRIVGWYAILRGLWLFAHSMDRNGEMGEAFVHVIFGAAAANIVFVLNTIGITLGSTASGFVTRIFG